MLELMYYFGIVYHMNMSYVKKRTEFLKEFLNLPTIHRRCGVMRYHVCACVCVCVCMLHACMPVCVRVCLHVFVYVCVWVLAANFFVVGLQVHTMD